MGGSCPSNSGRNGTINFGTISILSSNGIISGANGGRGKNGGTAVDNESGTITQLSNSGTISGLGGAGIANVSAISHSPALTTLTLHEGTTPHAFDFAGFYSRSAFHIASRPITTITFA